MKKGHTDWIEIALKAKRYLSDPLDWASGPQIRRLFVPPMHASPDYSAPPPELPIAIWIAQRIHPPCLELIIFYRSLIYNRLVNSTNLDFHSSDRYSDVNRSWMVSNISALPSWSLTQARQNTANETDSTVSACIARYKQPMGRPGPLRISQTRVEHKRRIAQFWNYVLDHCSNIPMPLDIGSEIPGGKILPYPGRPTLIRAPWPIIGRHHQRLCCKKCLKNWGMFSRRA